MERITSRQNSFLKQIGKWNSSRAQRRADGVFTGEGPKLLEEAVKAGVEVTAVVVEEGYAGILPPAQRQIAVPGDLLQSLCDTKTPQGVLFVCKMPDLTPPEKLPQGKYLVLDGLQDPGNVGTIWRTADALGADGLILVHNCADPFSPKTVRSTMGACFRLPVYEMAAEELSGLLRTSEIPLYATALREDTVDVRDVKLNNCAVVIGSEGRGISDTMLQKSERTIKIPMRERCESLNAASAATIVLWEMAR